MTTEELLREQQTDAFCRSIQATMESGPQPVFAVDENGVLCRTGDDTELVILPEALPSRMIHISYYAPTAGHAGSRKLYETLRRTYYLPALSLQFYQVAHLCTTCAHERVKLRRHSTKMQLSPVISPLTSVSIDLHGQLMCTLRGNRCLLVSTDRFFESGEYRATRAHNGDVGYHHLRPPLDIRPRPASHEPLR